MQIFRYFSGRIGKKNMQDFFVCYYIGSLAVSSIPPIADSNKTIRRVKFNPRRKWKSSRIKQKSSSQASCLNFDSIKAIARETDISIC